MLRALISTVIVLALAGCGGSTHRSALQRIALHDAGITLLLPHSWRANDASLFGASSVLLSTYPIARVGDITETPPKGETWLLLYDYGPIWTRPSWARQFLPLPNRLPPEAGIEGFGSGRNLSFKADGHIFQAFIKGDPGPTDALAVLRSIRFTAYGRSLALTISSRTVDGVQIWRVGNSRSKRRLIVVGYPGLATSCSSIAVTNRLVNAPGLLAANLWVIERLRGREDVLARHERRLRPEATIRLGTIRHPDAWTRRILALAR